MIKKIKEKSEILTLVKQNGRDLRYASDELQNDKEVVLEAVKQDGNALQFASLELQNEIKQIMQDNLIKYLK